MQKSIEDVIYGTNAVLEAFNNVEITKVYMAKDYKNKEIDSIIKKKNIPFVNVDKFALDKMTKKGNHQGIAVVVSPVDYIELNDLIQKLHRRLGYSRNSD